jgi:hypothetical protein
MGTFVENVKKSEINPPYCTLYNVHYKPADAHVAQM